MGRMIGIDLGTTNSVAAIMDGTQPRVLENREAKTQTRSVVGVRKRRGKGDNSAAEVLIGDVAVDNWPLAPKDTIVSVKRLMGRGIGDPEVERVKTWALFEVVKPAHGTRDSVSVVMGGREYSPIEISSLILKKVKEDAEFRLGEPVTHAVITVPAYFSQIQRDATRRAGLMAGLKVIKILDEPTAAAIAFGMQSSDDTPRTVLVYDLGGGTFDISVLMCAGNVFAPLNLEGDMWLGGDNFDQALVEQVVSIVRRDHGVDSRSNLRFMAELKRAAQSLKERLSSAESADLIVTGLLQDGDGNLIDVEHEFTRTEFERLIQTFVERSVELTRKALANPSVNLSPDQIDHVLMAGNSTNVPLVQRTMENIFGRDKLVRKVHPKHAVAMGAAMVAAWMGQRCICQAPDPEDGSRECGQVNGDEATSCERCGASLGLDADDVPTVRRRPSGHLGGIAPFNYGTQSAGDAFSVFIPKGDPFPTQNAQAQIFRTRIPRQRMVSIPIWGGDILDRASANQKQGEAFAVLPPDLPQGTAVRVKLWLDRDGVFDLAAHVEDGTDLRPWVVKGGEDARAIGAIQEVDKVLAVEGGQLPSVAMARVDAARNRVFERLRGHDFEGAFQEAQEARAQIEAATSTAPQQSQEEAARGLLRWAEFVLDHYGWAFDPALSYRLQGLISELRDAIGARDAGRIQSANSDLDSATMRLPEIVDVLLRMRHTITSRVRPAQPARAASLMKRLEELEDALQARAPGADKLLDQLMSEILSGVEGAARATGLQCSGGHTVPKGERLCPQCGEDTWSLDAGGSGPRSRS